MRTRSIHFCCFTLLTILCSVILGTFFSQSVTAATTCDIDTCEVQSVEFIGDGLRAEWSLDGQKIIYHKAGSDRFYDVYTMNADASNATCLTCNKPGLPTKHIGNPSWYPTKEYFVFQAQKQEHWSPLGANELAHPGIGYNNDLWLGKADGSQFWQLTNLTTKMSGTDPAPITGLLHGHFSRDGKKLAWAEKIGNTGAWGEWAIKIADFSITATGPALANIQTVQPGTQKRYIETNDFSLDNRFMTIAGNLELGHSEMGIDLYRLDLTNMSVKRLTYTERVFDESAHYSPSGDTYIWLSTHNYDPPPDASTWWWEWAETDLWMMDMASTTQKQLTFFNTPGTAHAQLAGGNRVITAYVDWHPQDENTVLQSMVIHHPDGRKEEKIARLTLGDANQCGLGDINCDGVLNSLDLTRLVEMIFAAAGRLDIPNIIPNFFFFRIK